MVETLDELRVEAEIDRERKLVQKVESFISGRKTFGLFQIGFIIATELHAFSAGLFFLVFPLVSLKLL